MNDARLPPQRELRPGRDYAMWPTLKWRHAVRLHQRFLDDYRLWRGSLGAETRPEYSLDRRVVTFFAAINNAPPTYEWSLAFGDVIHNYRSALDALAWSMAHLDGRAAHPRHEKRIYFPLAKSPTEFDALAKGALSSIPLDILDRMRSVQPFYAPDVERAIGVILHNLDIQDKHRSSIEMHALAADRTTYQQMWRYEDPNNRPEPGSEGYQWLAPDGPLLDGDAVARLTFAAPVEDAEISSLPLALIVDLEGNPADVFELLWAIEKQVKATFGRVHRGFLPDDAERFGMSAAVEDIEGS